MVLTLLAFAFVLGVAIIVHEFGHFIVAKKSGIYVKTFSIGFGRKFLKKRIGETVYALSIIPFGGYVKFAGEMEGEEQSEAPQGDASDETPDSEIDPDRYFKNKGLWIRGAVVFAGPFANYLLAVVLYAAMFSVDGLNDIPSTRVGEVFAGSPADSVGLRDHDEIIAVNGEAVARWTELEDALIEDIESVKTLSVRRDGEVLSIDYKPRVTERGISLGFDYFVSTKLGNVKRDGPAYRAGLRPGAVVESINDTVTLDFSDLSRIIHANPEVPLLVRWSLDGVQHADTIIPRAKKAPKGNSMTEFEIVGQIGVGPAYDKERVAPPRALWLGFKATNSVSVQIVAFMKLLFTGKAGIDTVGGPILIGQMAGEMARWGFGRLVYFLAFLSVNLGIFNLLPVLPFDGGHLTLFLFEGVTRRPMHPKLRERLAQAGFILLIAVAALVISLDLVRCTGSSPGLF